MCYTIESYEIKVQQSAPNHALCSHSREGYGELVMLQLVAVSVAHIFDTI